MSDSAEALRQENEQLRAKLAQVESRSAELEKENLALSEQIAWFRRYFLARKADELPQDEKQHALEFDEAEVAARETAQPVEKQQVRGHTRRTRPRRRPLPDDLPREQRLVDIEEKEKHCGCGAELRRIGEERSEKLDVEPPRVRVIETIRPKYACKACEGSADEEKPAVRIAPAEPTILPGSLITVGTLAYIVVSKFVDALPLYRQEKQFRRMGVDVSRRTMADWMIAAASACEPVMEALGRRLRSGPAMLIDETTAQVLREPDKPNTAKSHVWVAYGGEPEHPVLLYRYEPTRSGTVVKNILAGFQGYAQTDAYSGYDWSIAEAEGVRHVGCLAHVRRKFVDAAHSGMKAPSAQEAVAKIAKIYAVERELASRPRDEAFREEREERVRPLLEKFRTWLKKKKTQIPEQTALGKAVNYALEQLPKIERYLECPHLTPDTNRVENAIRPFVLTRKNFLFSGSPRGADASMTLFSLIETAKANKVEPYWYLRTLFERLATFDPADDYAKLLPWNLISEPPIGRPPTDRV